MANKAGHNQAKADKLARGAEKALLQELFNDFYDNRHKIYRMNFVRGVFFGFGSVLGGTVVLAIAVWVLSIFVDFPLIGEFIQNTTEALDKTQ